MNTFSFRKNTAGFTLIEILTVVIILGILTAAGLSRYAVPDRARIAEVESSTRDLVTLMRSARASAMAGEVHEFPSGTVKVPVGGFGFLFNPTEKRGYVFADMDGDKLYDVNNDGGYLDQSEIIPDYINISATDTDPLGTGLIFDTSPTAPVTDNFWILFAPNSAEVTFGNSDTSQDLGATKNISLKLNYKDMREYEIKINKISRFFEVSLTK
ncbi:prepilin-type N-terminal cleavage/methylation domain-containing protein [Candidatus Peregrinibacteria bacterium]|nr:prepilin-type N-terminal cleavage/methylation domain-containing protein [Candidatus Peregrinibacteria bacterium]